MNDFKVTDENPNFDQLKLTIETLSDMNKSINNDSSEYIFSE